MKMIKEMDLEYYLMFLQIVVLIYLNFVRMVIM